MKKTIFIIIAVLIVIGGVWAIFRFVIGGPEDSWICENNEWIKHGAPSSPKPTSGCGEENKNVNAKEVAITNFDECAQAGYPIAESYPRQCLVTGGKSFTEDIGNVLEMNDDIQVSEPQPNQSITSPISVKGEARGSWYFEASFPIKIVDENEEILGTAIAQAQGDWMTEEFVPFSVSLSFSEPKTTKGFLILNNDNPSGLPEKSKELRIPLKFSQNNKLTLKVYFNNQKLDAEFSCNQVAPVERVVVRTEAVARAALEQLLLSPSQKEKDEGYLTNINEEVKIQSLSIKDGVAKADFNEKLDEGVGGSCRVAGIRAQITETLKQFASVREVVISINGRTEDILQP